MGGIFVEAWTYYDYIANTLVSMPNISIGSGSGVVLQSSYQKADGTIGVTSGRLAQNLNSNSVVN